MRREWGMSSNDEPGSTLIALVDELSRLRGRLVSAFRPVRERHGCSDLDMMVLSAAAGAATPPTVSRIGRSLGHPRQVVQRIADDLARRGLIGWLDNPEHKRARLLVLTDTGRALKREADEEGLQAASYLTDGIDPQVLANAVRSLQVIREKIEINLRGRDSDGEASAK
jgi:DNA-binding MarR family transcriptional regulator